MARFALWLLAVAACGGGTMVAEGTPQDLEELVLDALTVVEESIPAQSHCLEGLTITHAWELDDRAEYRIDSRTIVLRVPATAPHLEFSLVHEIAHHLETSCPGQAELRPVFLRAQGHPPDQAWFDGESWETTPSEQFATALARMVTGRDDPLRSLLVTDEARWVVEAWARDGVIHDPSAP